LSQMRPESISEIVNTYAEKVKTQYSTGHAKEHSYRAALEELVQKLLPDYLVTNEASLSAADRPDLTIWQKIKDPRQVELLKPIPVAYVEHKDIGVDLDDSENKKQLKRYLNLGNVVHTNNTTFRFYINKEKVMEIELAEINTYGQIVIDSAQYDQIAYWFNKLISEPVPTVRTPKALAVLMADRAKPIRWTIHAALEYDLENGNRDTPLINQFTAFKDELIHDLTPSTFADLYAQTIAYGLFAARYNDETPNNFSRQEAAANIPATNPFLQKFFREVAGYETEGRITWVLDNFANLFNYCDVHSLMDQYGKTTAMNHDPVIHFYETFLGEYDPKLRKSRGVYYTPQPVVSFIVNAVDQILQEEFNLPEGLADTSEIEVEVETGQHLTERKGQRLVKTTKSKRIFRKIQVLDPATGTGTFLNEVIKLTHSKFKGQEGAWPSFVENELLNSIYGFELLMAAYAMAHMKLGITLTETNYKPVPDRRLGIYLTNSLEPGEEGEEIPNLFGMARALTEEAIGANEVKNNVPVMVVVGNPPYSVSSSNMGKWIRDLIKPYKEGLDEKKINLDDDYIKFIRLAESMIERNGQGIVAMITNNSYLDGIAHRVMRSHLLDTFDKLYVLNLHGNSKKRETAPDGSKDENVFDIQQGVSILLGVKKTISKIGQGEVMYFDLYGTRSHKYEWLQTHKLSEDFEKVNLVFPKNIFSSEDYNLDNPYFDGVAIDELFINKGSGVETQKDKMSIFFNDEDAKKVLHDLSTLDKDTLINRYDLKEGRDWSVAGAKSDVSNNPVQIIDYNYKPFDIRRAIWTGTNGGIMAYPRASINKSLATHDNIGLVLMRKSVNTSQFSCVLVAKGVIDKNFWGFQSYIFPLYVYEDAMLDSANYLKRLNLNTEGVATLLGESLEFEPSPSNNGVAVGPQEVFDYIYAVLHSIAFRKKYNQFLKDDFPRIPTPKSAQSFKALSEIGAGLRKLHLPSLSTLDKHITTYPVQGDNIVHKINHISDKVWINDTQYFGGISGSIWKYYVGGYQPAQKWLKERKNRELTHQDITHYQKIIAALHKTIELQEKLDKIWDE